METLTVSEDFSQSKIVSALVRQRPDILLKILKHDTLMEDTRVVSMKPNCFDQHTIYMLEQLNAGRKVEAIKERRLQTGEGLTETKAFIDNLREFLRIPETPTTIGDLI